MKRLLLFAFLFVSVVSIRTPFASGVVVPPDEESVMIYGPTGADLLKWCGDVGALKVGDTVPPARLADAARNAGSCVGYIAGVNDAAIGYGSAMHPKVKRLFCVPSEVKIDQLIRVVRKWLEDNPSQLHLPSGVLVVHALSDAFPCK